MLVIPFIGEKKTNPKKKSGFAEFTSDVFPNFLRVAEILRQIVVPAVGVMPALSDHDVSSSRSGCNPHNKLSERTGAVCQK